MGKNTTGDGLPVIAPVEYEDETETPKMEESLYWGEPVGCYTTAETGQSTILEVTILGVPVEKIATLGFEQSDTTILEDARLLEERAAEIRSPHAAVKARLIRDGFLSA